MKKYRIPKIEEFIVGFEFEIYSEGYSDLDIEDSAGWYKYIYGKTNWRALEDLNNELADGNIRVEIAMKSIDKILDEKQFDPNMFVEDQAILTPHQAIMREDVEKLLMRVLKAQFYETCELYGEKDPEFHDIFLVTEVPEKEGE